MGRHIKRIAFHWYLVLNMGVCAVVFAPWAAPRETISGLMGRWTATELGWKFLVGYTVGGIIDRIYFWEPDHCLETFASEHNAREVLYP